MTAVTEAVKAAVGGLPLEGGVAPKVCGGSRAVGFPSAIGKNHRRDFFHLALSRVPPLSRGRLGLRRFAPEGTHWIPVFAGMTRGTEAVKAMASRVPACQGDGEEMEPLSLKSETF
jgi:hypothetical protein